MSTTTKDKKSFVLRVQPEMMEALEKWASDEFRSTNGQIEYLLSEALKKSKRFPKKVKSSTTNSSTH